RLVQQRTAQIGHRGSMRSVPQGKGWLEAIEELRHRRRGIVIEGALQKLDTARRVIASHQLQHRSELLAMSATRVDERQNHRFSAILAKLKRSAAGAQNRKRRRLTNRIARKGDDGENAH